MKTKPKIIDFVLTEEEKDVCRGYKIVNNDKFTHYEFRHLKEAKELSKFKEELLKIL